MSDLNATNLANQSTITLHGTTAEISAGAHNVSGSVALLDGTGTRRVHITSGAVSAYVPGQPHLPPIGEPTGPTLWKAPPETITLDGEHGIVIVGSDHAAGVCYCTNASGVATVQVRGYDGAVVLSDAGGAMRTKLTPGAITLKDDKARDRVVVDSSDGWAAFGGNGGDGGLALFPDSATDLRDWSHATIQMNGGTGEVTIGKKTNGGKLWLVNKTGDAAISLDGTTADVTIGMKDNGGRLFLCDKTGAATITVDGTEGDIFLANGDCAEDFDVAAIARELGIAPGTVVVLDDAGAILPCTEPYDGRVAGVVSGAGAYRPALVLDRRASATPRLPVALVGKVHCLADASAGPIRPGDLLTTSATPGHAMKAADRARAFGAVIGKALGPLAGGAGVIPMLVTLK